MVRLNGIEPSHMASEATALSTELQAHIISLQDFTSKNPIILRKLDDEAPSLNNTI